MLRVRLDCWNPEPETVTEVSKYGRETSYKFHSYVGGVSVELKTNDLELAKNRARELWKQYYEGAMKRIQIFDGREKVFEHDDYKSKI
jgi:hypothetical protein